MGASTSAPRQVLVQPPAENDANKDQHNPERAIVALKELQKTLHLLSPAEQWEVKKSLPFATTEWQEGLALSLKPLKPAFGESVHGQSFFSGATKINAPPETAAMQRERLSSDADKLVLVLVGLPARGKSMYGNKIQQFLTWRGYKTQYKSVGAWRRGEREDRRSGKAKVEDSPSFKRRGLRGLSSLKEEGKEEGSQAAPAAAPSAAPSATNVKESPNTTRRAQYSSSSFFDSTKAFATMTRDQITLDAFKELLAFLQEEDGQVGIFDASNVTIARRAKLTEMVNQHAAKHNIRTYARSRPQLRLPSTHAPCLAACRRSIVFIESIVTDESIVRNMMQWKVRHSSLLPLATCHALLHRCWP